MLTDMDPKDTSKHDCPEIASHHDRLFLQASARPFIRSVSSITEIGVAREAGHIVANSELKFWRLVASSVACLSVHAYLPLLRRHERLEIGSWK